MDAKKRAATATSHDEPVAKKHAGEGVGARQEGSQDHRLTRSRLKKFKKDAIFRAMQSYKHEKELIASQANETRQKLFALERIFALQESWWENLADQISVLLAGHNLPARPRISSDNFLFKLQDEEEGEEEDWLKKLDKTYNDKNDSLKEKIAQAFQLNVNGKSDEEETIQQRLSKTLQELHQLQAENSSFKIQNERLDRDLAQLTDKYISTERKIERLKSSSLRTLFGSSTQHNSPEPDKTESASTGDADGIDVKPTPVNDEAAKEELLKLKSLLEQSEAVVTKQKSQLNEQESRIDRLNDSIRTISNRLANLSENDVAQSAPFRSLRRRNEELLNQIDKLESYVSRYQREKLALIDERTDFQQGIKADADSRVHEIQTKLTKTESDLARIRAARDDLISALNVKKAAENERHKGMDQLKELASIREARIQTLESEVKRLKDDPSLQQNQTDSSALENASPEELKSMVQRLQRQHASLVDELPSLEAAFTQAHQKATAKVLDMIEREAKTNKLAAEKTKADEKYFSAMRAKDALNNEYQKVKTQLAKSAEMVQQLKDAEKKQLLKSSGLEARVEELKDKQVSWEKDRAAIQMKVIDAERRMDSMRSLIDKLNGDIKAREKSVRQEIEDKRALEIENEKLKKQVEIKNLTTVGSSSGKNGHALDLESQLEELRSIAICSVCTKNWKDTAIKVCGHVMCNDCAVSRLTNRLRKCPLCNRQFSQSDLLAVHL